MDKKLSVKTIKHLLISNRLDLWIKSEGILSAVVKSHTKARVLNKLLKYYAEDTKFKKGDEPVFTASVTELNEALLKAGLLR